MMNYKNLTSTELDFFQQHGYLTVPNLLTADELEYYRQLYDDFLNGTLDTEGLRSDLSGETTGDAKAPEKITQIMRPSLIVEELIEKALHQRALHMSQQLLGDDMAMDFDMLIAKAPFTDKITPWHQDEAYWLNMPDKRAVSCWVALDPSTKANGCMWYVPGSHREELRPHGQVGNKGALVCECNEDEAIAEELMPGSCTFHHGRTLHYSRGNSTATNRRAFIVNFRPAEMIAFERALGYDHTGERKAQK